MSIFAASKRLLYNKVFNMMKKVILIIAAVILVGKAAAQTLDKVPGELYQEMAPLEQTYLENVFTASGWDANWFVSAKGGVSAFVGNPLGHGDIFDRTKPLVNISAGKWFTPFVGCRLAFQGLQLIDSDIESRDYQNFHVDFIYNIASHFRRNYDELPKWDFFPYIGTGLLSNSQNRNRNFALSYGIVGRYRIAPRVHIAGEIGASTTFQDFDGNGSENKLGDHLIQASIGLDITIGKIGWSKVVDPKPYIYQYDVLMENITKMQDEMAKLDKLHQKDNMQLKELKKILEIEGLLDKYQLTMADEEEVKTNPKNNYSGLNSLRARLRNKGWNGDKNNYKPKLTDKNDSTLMNPEDYFKTMKDGKIFVGSPIYFFFKIGTDNLTEKAQIINIKEVANCIKKYGLNARIIGAADSQTGTPDTNERLSSKRAEYIAKLMRKEGVQEDKIQTQYRGGIDSYEPLTGNRNTCIMLYFK